MRTIKGFKLYSASWTRAVLCLAVCMLGLSLSAMAKGPTYITFDVPGAAPGCCQGTQPYAISVTGAVVGTYFVRVVLAGLYSHTLFSGLMGFGFAYAYATSLFLN